MGKPRHAADELVFRDAVRAGAEDARCARRLGEAHAGRGARVADLALKMASAGSVPAAAAVWQEWSTEQMRLFSEDSKRMIEDLQEALTTGSQALTQNWSPTRDEGRGRHSAS